MGLSDAKLRNVDHELHNKSPSDFIPAACHYDPDTILTKNGELVQIIQIHGLNADTVSEQLLKLRDLLRQAIKKNVLDSKFAFWIHTVRSKTNLDDMSEYQNLFAANLHEMWRKKNYWDDKFVNTLYISVVYSGPKLRITNFDSFVNTLSFGTICKFYDQYWDYSVKILYKTVDAILSDLAEYGADRLTTIYQDHLTYSEPMSLYRKIVHLDDAPCLMPVYDISISLSAMNYVVGGDKIEIVLEDKKRFAGIISIKEYHEVAADALDKFLQLPIELIATGVFYFIDKKDAVPSFKDQDYILSVSGDNELRDQKGFSEIFANKNNSEFHFCNQQISVIITASSTKKLEQDIATGSRTLSKIGIVHVREDINLEQTFWASLPGNFGFLKRMSPSLLRTAAALASLHNFPTGKQRNKWGRAITILRTERATPYFANLHVTDNRGHTCIFGSSGSGKTVMMNFFISESMKFNPSILHLSTKDNSEIFINVLNGQWHASEKGLINPFLIDNPEYVIEFLKIVCGFYTKPLSDEETNFIVILFDQIKSLPNENRNFDFILKNCDFSLLGGEQIKAKLSIFAEGQLYHGLFNADQPLRWDQEKIAGYNLGFLSEHLFKEKFYPKDKKLLDKYNSDLLTHINVRTALIYLLIKTFLASDLGPKIIAFDEMYDLVDFKYYLKFYTTIFDVLEYNNCVAISNMNPNSIQNLDSQIWSEFDNFIDAKIIMPLEIEIEDFDKMMGLSSVEKEKLNTFSIASRMFLIKTKQQTVAVELSIGVFTAMLKMLSNSHKDLEIYNQLKQEKLTHEDFVDKLYHALS